MSVLKIKMWLLSLFLFVIFGDFETGELKMKPYKIASKSMTPCLHNGDRVFADLKAPETVGVGTFDLVIFPFPKDPSREFIKRVIGMPGEVIEIKKQVVYIDGEPLHEPYVYHSKPVSEDPHSIRDNLTPVTVPENHIFVLGDNRENSMDSRHWGFVNVNEVLGIMTFRYYPFTRFGSLECFPETISPQSS